MPKLEFGRRLRQLWWRPPPPMGERIALSLAQGRFNTRLLTGLGAVGLIVAAIGIYGVIGSFVARQSRELGIRVTLGAPTRRIRALVLRQGLGPPASIRPPRCGRSSRTD